MARKKLTVFQRIMAAAERGTGIRLSADEVDLLSKDQAIYMVAQNDDAGYAIEPSSWHNYWSRSDVRRNPEEAR